MSTKIMRAGLWMACGIAAVALGFVAFATTLDFLAGRVNTSFMERFAPKAEKKNLAEAV